jgi:hypothetical protein
MPESWELFKIFSDNAAQNGDLKTAEEYLWKAIDAAAETNSPLKLILCMDSLGDFYYRLKRFSEAQSIYSDNLEKQISGLGLDHPEVANTLIKLGSCQNFQNRMKEAEDSYKQALLITIIRFGLESVQAANIVRQLSAVYQRQGKVFDIREVTGGAPPPPPPEPIEAQTICRTCHRPYKGAQCPTCTQFRMTAMKLDEQERLQVVIATRDIRPGTVITISSVALDFRMASKFDAYFDVRHVVGKTAVNLVPQGAALKLNDIDLRS